MVVPSVPDGLRLLGLGSGLWSAPFRCSLGSRRRLPSHTSMFSVFRISGFPDFQNSTQATLTLLGGPTMKGIAESFSLR